MMIRQHETHMLPCPIHLLPLFFAFFCDDAVCNLHAASSIYLFRYQLMTRHATYTLCRFFFRYQLMMQCATYTPHHQFLSFTVN